MEFLKNKKILTVIAIVILGLIFIFLKNKNSERPYSELLWNRLSSGDASSTECQKAIDRYSSQHPLDGTNVFDSFYSYSKKRCFGMETLNFNSKYVGHDDRIFDLITDDTLVSCRVFPVEQIIFCEDNESHWESNNDKPADIPVYPVNFLWLDVKKLGGE